MRIAELLLDNKSPLNVVLLGQILDEPDAGPIWPVLAGAARPVRKPYCSCCKITATTYALSLPTALGSSIKQLGARWRGIYSSRC